MIFHGINKWYIKDKEIIKIGLNVTINLRMLSKFKLIISV